MYKRSLHQEPLHVTFLTSDKYKAKLFRVLCVHADNNKYNGVLCPFPLKCSTTITNTRSFL